MSAKLKDKVVVITGASSGIGAACAKIFGKQGAKIVLGARNIEELSKLAKILTNSGIEAIAVKTDVSIEADCKNLVEKAIDKFNTIDILVNNAGISMRASFAQVDLGVLRKLMDVNFWGMVYCTKYALPYILKSKGSIVGVSSVAGFRGLPGRTGYSASKFAMNGFLEALRTELLKKEVHVMVIAPGFTASNIRNTALNEEGNPQSESPLKEEKLMPPEEVAEYILKGIIKKKRTVILTLLGKASVVVNNTLPNFMDNMTYNRMKKEKDAPF